MSHIRNSFQDIHQQKMYFQKWKLKQKRKRKENKKTVWINENSCQGEINKNNISKVIKTNSKIIT